MQRKYIVWICLIALCIAGIIVGRDWRGPGVTGEYELTNLLCSAKDPEDNTYVVEQSGESLVKLDRDGVLRWRRMDFSKATDVVCDGQGNVYVHDTVIEQGVRVTSERVAVYRPDGTFVGDIFSYEYKEAPLSPNIVGMVSQEDGIICFVRGKNGYTKLEAVMGEDGVYEGNTEQDYLLADADVYLNSVTWNSVLNMPCYVTFDGKVFAYEPEGTDRLLYDSDTSEELSVPYQISCDQGGMLYVTDLGKRRILKIDPETQAVVELSEEDSRKDEQIAYTVDAGFGIMACTSDAVKLWEGEDVRYISSAAPAFRWRAAGIGFWLSIVILSVILLILLVWGIKYVINSATKFTRIVVAMVVGVMTVGLMFVGILLPQFMKQITDSVFSRAQLASALTAKRIPHDSFERLNRPSDFMQEDYLAVKDCVEEIFLMEDESISEFYCTMYSVKDDGLIVRSYTLENEGTIYPYDWEYEGSEEQSVLTSKKGKTFIYQATEGSYLFVLNPLLDGEGNAVGLIEVGTDLDTVVRESYRLIADMFITVLAMMVAVILLVMEVIYFARGRSEMKEQRQRGMKPSVQPEILRMITFLIFFLTNLATSFLPVYAMKISGNAQTFGLPAEVLAAIPISAEVLSGAIFSILGVGICEKLGNGKAVVLGGIAFTLGFGLRVIPNIWVLTLGNCLLGLGWGIILLLVNTRIAMMPDKEKDEGFSHYNAAGLNGVNGGVVLGGFLVQWVSYNALFIITTVLSLLVLGLAKKYLSEMETEETAEENAASGTGTARFLFQPGIIGYFVLLLTPLIACGYYLNYMYPIIGAEWGLSETNIGYSYLLNGLCVMLLSGTLTNAFHAKKRQGLVLSVLLYVLAFVVVAMYQNIPALFVAMVLLGISDSFGLPLLTSYYTDDEMVERYGYDRAMGVYSLFENGAQAAGSFVFSYVLLIGVKRGMLLVSGVLAVTLALFVLMSSVVIRKKRKG